MIGYLRLRSWLLPVAVATFALLAGACGGSSGDDTEVTGDVFTDHAGDVPFDVPSDVDDVPDSDRAREDVAAETDEGEPDGEEAEGGDGTEEDGDTPDCTVDLECNDDVDCTVDSCDPVEGTCSNERMDDFCSDGDPCTGTEFCDVVLGCQPGTPVVCEDSIDCTVDSCNRLSGACEFAADHDLCTAPEMCDPDRGGCAPPPTCAIDDDCDDDDPCNGVETCGPDLLCAAGTPIVCDDGVDCTTDQCNRTDGSCEAVPDDSLCSDDLACNGDEACTAAGCVPGTPMDCNDGIGCTADSCNETTDRCAHVPDNTSCGDMVYCNGDERCDTALGCVPGTPPACSDGILCTTDRCDAATDVCVNAPSDAACDDRAFCNGAERCVAGVGCSPGTLPNCADAIACTIDTCDPAASGGAGACVHSPPDVDGDTYPDMSCTGTDCDDLDPLVHPDMTELCNASDDDCDTLDDETFACVRGVSGACTTTCSSSGTRTCSGSCTWGSCTPPAESCNGRDDDCDTSCDNGWVCCAGATGTCSTSCGSSGSRTCSAACGWGSCTPPAETCNGADDDCDAAIDEVFACVSGSSRTCTASCGSSGTQACSVTTCTWGTCNAPAETCNGVDDDCDTTVDDGFACPAGSSGSCSTTCGSTGSRTCSGSCAWGACNPPVELCNGLDDDCVSGADNGFACVRGATGSCTTSCGTAGTRTCSASCVWGACTAGSEVCNGVDDNCNGSTDEGFTCPVGSSGTCTTSCGSTGNRTCNASCAWGACTAPAESCNGLDDDCDTVVDDGYTCPAGSSGSCSTSCGSTGSRSCTGSCTWGSCNAPAETCNAVDDDCDTAIDETYPCVRGASGSCTTSCGSTGSHTCSTSCIWGTCNPPAEACNGLDDDCDTVTDDGYTCPAGSSGSCTTSCGSTGSRSCTGSCIWGTCNAPAELCNGLDDDCVSGADNGFTCILGATGACTTSCGTAGTRTCGAGCTWGACTAGAEVCNGVDDNCNGSTDEGWACPAGSVGSCTVGSCTGTRTCSASCAWGACNLPAETCNGVDDNCNGSTDEGWACPAGSTGSCTVGSCTGTRTCSASCAWGACTVTTPEVCNGVDDNCNGSTDEGYTCRMGATQGCTNACGAAGTQTCAAGSCTWGACCGAEVCGNGCDDDCDTLVDEGCGCSGGENCTCVLTVAGSGGTYSGSTSGMANDYTASCGNTAGSPDVVYSFTPSTSGTWQIDTIGTTWDTVLHLHSGGCPGTEMACDDDGGGSLTSRITATLTAGVTYYIVVDGYGTTYSGPYTLHVTPSSCTPTVADTCAGATCAITASGSWSGNSCSYLHDYTPSTCAYSGSNGYDVVYALTVGYYREVQISLAGSSFDTVLYVRSGSCTGTEVGCNDDYSGTTSYLDLWLDAGTYYVIIDGYYDSTYCGAYSMAVTFL